MANSGQTRSTTILLWIGGLVGAILIIFGIRALTREKIPVRVTTASLQPLISTVPTTGKVEPIHEYQAHAPGPGVIQKIYVEVNQHIKAGTLLMRMNDADAIARLASAQSTLSGAQLNQQVIGSGGTLEERTHFNQDIAAAQTEQRNAQNDLATEQKLQQQGAASAGEVLRAQQRLQTANTALANAQSHTASRFDSGDQRGAAARLNDAKNNLTAAQAGVAAVDIRSPIDGTVYSIPFSAYDFVPSGADDLLDVADLTKLQVRAYFDEPVIGQLAQGQPVKIVWDARPNVAWHGHILRAPTTVSSYGTRSVGEAIITVDDAKGDLLPNVNVTVTVTVSELPDALSIPREALHTEGANNYVYRIVNGHLTQTPVKVGAVNLTRVQITSGLDKNETVVLGPVMSSQELVDGLQVIQVK
ncbi:efflux RND transporter periplasmic adaptor subunit [Granulicella tundricola]|uniref:Efflux transporter, RND family, MFP subunit n=1 Tax=Granulicella tundricola (strain ATCC BAA-1859 / DSM 23138 / MP5ACTX9) TaxID=1198114 RepID=E8WY74_GRATM|nr:efflux RND transporter periplasmic adaptor subunit [Granulicella tundricola]ADW68701.1 efflux transporter, RND family, MFP subunit [Granulicella tundricola MP5ACTX9]